MLTIGEVAKLAGTTVRAVRHYHAVGLLPEPERDRSGYRRYGAAALVRLLRVRRLRQLGLPLERIADLLDTAEPAVDDALDALDAELAAQAERIAEQRARLAQLRAASADPEVPAPLARIFATAAAEGMPLRVIQQEKEMLLLSMALHPELADTIVAEYEVAYERARGRPGYQDLALRFDALADADPGDPAVEALASDLASLVREQQAEAPEALDAISPIAERLVRDWTTTMPAAQARLMDLVAELASHERHSRPV